MSIFSSLILLANSGFGNLAQPAADNIATRITLHARPKYERKEILGMKEKRVSKTWSRSQGNADG